MSDAKYMRVKSTGEVGMVLDVMSGIYFLFIETGPRPSVSVYTRRELENAKPEEYVRRSP